MVKQQPVNIYFFNEYLIGTKLIVIDPENEYGDFARNLKGNVIDISGGNENIINPLQIRVNFDDNNGIKNSYDFHIQKIRNFFNILLPELRYTELNLLIRELEKTYTNFKINRETDFTKLNNKDYPILSDLYKTIRIVLPVLIKMMITI